MDGLIPEGKREATLTSIPGAARRQGAQQAELRALAEATNTRCQPPLGSRDLDRLARSIARYEPDTLDMTTLFASVETTKSNSAPAPELSFVTPVDLMADRQAQLDYVVQPFLIAGVLTDVTGAAKVGKTRVRNYIIRCAVRGEPCFGYPASLATKVVLLTEEPTASLMEGLAAAGLQDTSDVAILTRYAARTADWPTMVAAAVAKAKAIGAHLLIVDTLPGLAGLEGDAENSAGHALAALRPLQEADAPDLAKLVIRHTRKSGGNLVEAGRGSSAFAGEADVLVSISKPMGARPTVRRFEAIGRFEAIPPVLTVERVTVLGSSSAPTDLTALEPKTCPAVIESYQIVSDPADAADPETASVAERVAQALPRTPVEAVTVCALAESVKLSERNIRYGLTQLGSHVARRGAGTRWDPFKFYVTAVPDLKELTALKPTNNTKGGTTMLAIQADERGPPVRAEPAVHEETGTWESPGHD